jgi:integrase
MTNRARRANGEGHYWYDADRKRYRWQSPDGKRSASAESRAKLNARVAAVRAETPPSGYTVASAADEWLREHVAAPACRPSTHSQYEYLLRVYVLPSIGDKPVEKVLPKDIQAIVNGMGKSPRTVRHAHKTIRALYNWLILNDKVTRTPVRGIKLPEVGVTTRKSLSPDELSRLMTALGQSRWKHSVEFALLTGLRRGELLALQWQDVQTDDKGRTWLMVSRSIAGTGLEGPPKSRAGTRSIRIGKAVQGILDAQRAMLEIDGVESAYIFPAESGRPVRPATYYTTLRKYAARAGIRLSVHELRHTFVSLAGRGMDLKTLQTVLGHTSSTLTLDIYRHLIDGDAARASDVIDRAASRYGIGAQSAPQSAPNAKEQIPETRKPAP